MDLDHRAVEPAEKISSDRAIGISVTPSSVLWIGFLLAVVSVALVVALVVIGAIAKWGSYWLQAYFANADVSFASLIAMTLLGLDLKTIVNAKVMGRQAGLRIDHGSGGMTTQRLQAHALAGGNVDKVVTSLVVANGAGLVFDFDTAAAIDLAGRDVLAAIQARVFPKVIRCPIASGTTRTTLSGVSKDGVELRVSVCVTVRTNMEKLIGGATEETIIARVGESIVANIGASEKHTDILALPSLISSGSRANELSENTIFDIVSIDVAIVSVGTNIGARLVIDQAEADMLVSISDAEGRRCQAVARTQLMKASVIEQRAIALLKEADVQLALAEAYRRGNIGLEPDSPPGSFDRSGHAAQSRRANLKIA